MENFPDHNLKIETDLRQKIEDAAAARYGSCPPPAVRRRIDAELEQVFRNGLAVVLRTLQEIADYSVERGYPVGFRGNIGNLFLSYLLGITRPNPMELNLRWEALLGRSGNRKPDITLNLAEELYGDIRAYLTQILPDYNILYARRDILPWKLYFAPKASATSGREFALDLCSHKLMSDVGNRVWQAGIVPRDADVLSENFLSASSGELEELLDAPGFRELADLLDPKTLPDLTKLLGLCLSPELQVQTDCPPEDGLAGLIACREDVFDLCLRCGVPEADAFFIMRRIGMGKYAELSKRYTELLDACGVLREYGDLFEEIRYLYPRGQCADYIYWALTLAWQIR